MKETVADLEHSHVMGGSNAEQRILCPGSFNLESKMPKMPASDFAARGSMLHSGMQYLLENGAKGSDDTLNEDLLAQCVGQSFGFGTPENGLVIDEELAYTKLWPALKAWFEVIEKYDIVDYFIEQRVSLEKVVPGAFGTADILAKDRVMRLHTLDWKFGDGIPVEVQGSYQHGFYAGCALYDPDPEIEAFCKDITGVILHVVQPRVGATQVLFSWPTTVEWVEQVVDAAYKSAHAARQPNAPLRTGKHCRWCDAKAVCPAFGVLGDDALSTQPKSMGAVELASALEKAELLRGWIADVFKLATAEATLGAAIPGWKLVPKMPRRHYKVESEAVVAKICKGARLKIDEYHAPRELLSPAQMEKAHKRLYKDRIAAHVELRSSGVTLAHDSDSREAVSVSPMGTLATIAKSAGLLPVTLDGEKE